MGLSPCHARMQARSPSKPTGGPGSRGQAGGGRSPVPPPTSWPPSTHVNPRLQGMLSWPNTQISRRQVCKAEEPTGTHVLTHTRTWIHAPRLTHARAHMHTPHTRTLTHTHHMLNTHTHAHSSRAHICPLKRPLRAEFVLTFSCPKALPRLLHFPALDDFGGFTLCVPTGVAALLSAVGGPCDIC